MPDPVDWSTSRAVLIGVSNYVDPQFLDIRAAANSIAELWSVLTDPRLCGWPADRVTVLPNPRDSRRVGAQIRQVASETSGVLLLYYVGHGTITDRGELCLTLTDTVSEATDLTGLEYLRIRADLLNSPARVKAVILDCCYSGRAVEALAGQAAVVADNTEIKGAYTLTASDMAAHVPPPAEQKNRCTSFTGELVDLIRTGIPGHGEYLTLGNLYQELRRRLQVRGLPAPNQRGTDTAHSFAFTRNTATPGGSSHNDRRVIPHFSPARPSRRRHVVRAVCGVAAAVATVVLFVVVTERNQTFDSARPGCDQNDADVQWKTTGTEVVSCGNDGSRLAKLARSTGNLAEANGELRFSLAGEEFPSDYQLTVTVSGMSDQDPASEGACAGLATHTNANGTTFEELAVCSDQYDRGKAALVTVRDGVEIDRDEIELHGGDGVFTLEADVSADRVTFTVSDQVRTVATLHTSAVSSTTSYVGLGIFWMSAGATATFSDFHYDPGAW